MRCKKDGEILKNMWVRLLLFMLTAAMLVFIFGMSSMNSEDSAEVSVGLLNIINEFLENIGFSGILTDHILRKTAHFGEYFILGGLYILDMMSIKGYRGANIPVPLCVGILTGAADELSQNMSYGRAPMYTDVFIDSCGILAGILFIYAIKKTAYAVTNYMGNHPV